MANGPLEGLTYFLKPGVSMQNFIEFLMDGEKVREDGPHVTTANGEVKTGVLNWLRGIKVFDANFFIATEPAPMAVVSLSRTGIPWIGIPGFMELVRTGPVPLDLGNGQIILESRRDLDAALSESRTLFERVPVARRKDLESALRGDAGTNLADIVRSIDTEAQAGIKNLLEDSRAIGESLARIDAR